MPEYSKIGVVFKAINSDLFYWVKARSEEEDVSCSAFIIRALKKLRKEEADNG